MQRFNSHYISKRGPGRSVLGTLLVAISGYGEISREDDMFVGDQSVVLASNI